MSELTALVVGATGLVGGHLVERLRNDADYAGITLLVRRPSGLTDARVAERIVDFDKPDEHADALQGVQHVYCCLGTTLRAAGSQAAFRRVDFDYVADTARLAAAAGVRKFMLVSSLGADPQAANFYARTKGEAETAVAAHRFEAVHILRPSLLLGRRNEFRLGERIGTPLARLVAPLLHGRLRRYRPSDAGAVADLLVASAHAAATGVHVHFVE